MLDCEKLASLRFPSFWFEDSPQGKFVLSIAFSQSKYYSDALSVNVRRGMRQKLRRGEYPGRPPIGYLNEPRLRTIIADPHKAKLVRRMFEAYATGRYTFDALKELTDALGLMNHREKPLSRSMLPRLLVNPFYIGLFKFGGEVHEGSHPPIVSKALFDEVQNVMARRGHPHKPRREPLPYLGFIRCGECGASITGERQKGHHYYRCTRKCGPCSQKRFIREEALTDELRAITARVVIPSVPGEKMLAQVEKWRQTESDNRTERLNDEKARLSKTETRIARLLDVYIDGSIEQADYTRKKEELLHEKTGVKERIRRIGRAGSAWLEPMENFLNDAILTGTTAFSGTEQELRDFHRRIGSNLSLLEPARPKNAAQRRTRASKERAHPQPQESPETSSRRGGLAARNATQDNSGRQAGFRNPCPESTFENHPSRVTESHDSASPEKSVKKSSSRWADRPVPVLQVEFPEPWSIIASAASADAESEDFRKNPKWSGCGDLNPGPFDPQSNALPDCATPRQKNLC